MGLFRSRSTGLLRLGGALRDCCCRPQGPPPSYGCRCPSFVSKCGGDEGNYDHVVSLPYYGYANDLCIDTPGFTYSDNSFSGSGFSFFSVDLGRFSRDTDISGAGVNGSIEYQWFDGSGEGFSLFAYIEFYCGENRNLETGTTQRCLLVRSSLDVQWQNIVPVSPGVFNEYEIAFFGQHNTPLIFRCPPADARDNKTECCRDQLPPPAFLTIVASRDGLVVNGSNLGWETSSSTRRCEQVTYAGGGSSAVEIECDEPPWSDFLYRDSFELNLTTQGPCDECDCEADLSGRAVVFEGQSFSYGQGEDFSDGLVYLAEESPGFFKKIVYDDCNPEEQLKVSEKTASVYCLNVDGEDKWAALLVSICYERDDCDLVSERARTTTWDGLFNCGPEGLPAGSPEITLSSDINGTTGECSAALPPIPSITLA